MNAYAGVLPVTPHGIRGTGYEVRGADPRHLVASYHSAQILGASPIQLIVKIYEVAIVACGRRDTDRARRAVCELIAALNFDHDEIAVPLFRLYEYCLNRIVTGSCDEAAKVLRGLKQAWEAALAQADSEEVDNGLR